MSPAADPMLETPWVGALARLVKNGLGYEVPDHRMIREVVPFAIAEAEARGLTDPGVLVERAERGRDAEFWEGLVNLATIGETYFFRHPEQCAAIALWLRARHETTGRPLAIWSAGCSSGEEALTVAMLLEEAGIPYALEATDFSSKALTRAAAGGPFSERSVAHLPARFREGWLKPAEGNSWRLREERVTTVEVRRHNLVTEAALEPGGGGGWDAILCRNVLIYFSSRTGRDVIQRLGHVLEPGGSLWIAPCDHVDPSGLGLGWEEHGAERHLRTAKKSTPSAASTANAPSGAKAPVPAPPPRTSWTATVEGLLARDLLAGAADVVARRIEEAPEDGSALVIQAAFHLRAHAFGAALDALERASRSHPRPVGLDYWRGMALLRAGRKEEALPALLRSLQQDPDDWASGWLAADIYHHRGQSLLEEMMLRRTAELLETPSPLPPAFGPAALIVEGIHKDGLGVRRAVKKRLANLERPAPHPESEATS